MRFKFSEGKPPVVGSIEHVKTLCFHLYECSGEGGQGSVKMRTRMLGHCVTHGGHPGLQVLAEKNLLVGKVADGHVIPGNQVTHHLRHIGHMVFGLGHGLVPRQPQASEVGAQLGEWFRVPETAQVVLAKQVDLGLADAFKQGLVFGLDRRVRQAHPPADVGGEGGVAV